MLPVKLFISQFCLNLKRPMHLIPFKPHMYNGIKIATKIANNIKKKK